MTDVKRVFCGLNRSVLPLASLNLHNKGRKVEEIEDEVDDADRLDPYQDSITIWRGM